MSDLEITFTDPNLSPEIRNNTQALFDWLILLDHWGKPLPDDLKAILEEGQIDRDARSNLESGMLYYAAQGGHYEVVKSLLKQGASMMLDNDLIGNTPLHTAAQNGHADIMALLLEHGADIHARKRDGDTALVTACAYSHVEAVKLLLDHGAGVNDLGDEYYRPIHLSAMHDDKEITKLLLDHGVNLHVRNNKLQNPLEQAAEWANNTSTLARHKSKKLIEKAIQKAEKTWDAWHSGSMSAGELTKEHLMQLLNVWPLSDGQKEVPCLEQLDVIFSDSRWKDEHAEHKHDLIGQISGLSSREQMFLMGGHARALIQRQNAPSQTIER